VRVVGISSNSVELKPQDGPAEMAADAKKHGRERAHSEVVPGVGLETKKPPLAGGCAGDLVPFVSSPCHTARKEGRARTSPPPFVV